MENAMVTPVKLYMDRVLLGIGSQYLGTPQEMVESAEVRQVMQDFFKTEISVIPEDKLGDACLIVQADADLPCGYVTQIVSVGTSVGYANIYFATLEEADWLQSYRTASRM